VRAPVWLYRARLGFVFGSRLLMLEHTGRKTGIRRYVVLETVDHPGPVLAGDLAHRLVSIFLDDEHGRRPVFGDTVLFQARQDWRDLLPFHEYFHGDTGRGVGASHQTGWTALVADLVMRTAGRAGDLG
jgi:hypothetical protein